MKSEKDNETTITYLVSDQGNGGVICNKCKFYESFGHWGTQCPKCHRVIVNSDMYISPGGSDF